MKLALLMALVLVLLCLQRARAAPGCSLTNSTTARIPFKSSNAAKDYIVMLLAQKYPFPDFLKRLAKLQDKYLFPLVLQILQNQAYMKNVPPYEPRVYGEDFTAYCVDQSAPSLSSADYKFNNYSGHSFFLPLYRRSDMPAFRNAGRRGFNFYLQRVIYNMADGQLADRLLDTEYSLQNQDSADPGQFVVLAQAWKMNMTVPSLPERLCARGYNLWFRGQLQQVFDLADSPFQLNYWLNSLLIPAVAPSDLQIFVKWCAKWIEAVYEKNLRDASASYIRLDNYAPGNNSSVLSCHT